LLLDYASIALFLIFIILFAVVTLLLPPILRLLGIVPHKMNPIKTATYECGLETTGETWVQFNFRYYFYALIFVALDILVVFLYPFAVGLRGLGTFGFTSIVVFIIIIIVGYAYAWKKKVLEWK
jgi:NADH-quinone oxidoreductase subunit A